MMKTASLLLASIVSAAALGACGTTGGGVDPIANRWESRDPVGGFYNSLELDEDLTGDATVYYYASDGYLYYNTFRVEAEQRAEGFYELRMDCEGGCSDLSFRMECDMNNAADDMSCSGDGVWSQYAFDWRLS